MHLLRKILIIIILCLEASYAYSQGVITAGTNKGTCAVGSYPVSTITGTAATTPYLWQTSPDGSNWSSASGTNTGVNYTPAASSSTVHYRRLANGSPSNVIIVYVGEVLTAGTMAGDQTYCAPGDAPATTIVTAPTGGNQAYTYLWQQATAAAPTTWANASGTRTGATYDPPTGVTTTMLYRRQISSTGCVTVNSNTVTITVNAVPTITTPTGAPQTLCLGAAATALSTTGGAGSGTITQYEWYSNTTASNVGGTLVATNVSSTSPNTYTPLTSVAGALFYYVVITNSNGCTTKSAVTSAITINNPSTGEAAGPSSICMNSAAAALTGASVGGGATTGAWSILSGGGTLSSTAQSTTPNTRTYTPAVGYTGPVVLRLTTNALTGCTAFFDDRTITVNPRPTATFIAPPAGNICFNDELTYTTQAGQSNYVWTFTGTLNTNYTIVSGGDANSNTAVIKWLTTTGTKTVTVNYTDANGCTAASAATTSATAVASPTISAPTNGTQTWCQNGTALAMSVTGVAGSGTISKYEWFSNVTQSNTGGTLVATHTSALTTDTYTPLTTAAGVLYYYAVITNSNGCTKTSTVTNAITITQQPIAAAIGGTTSLCNGTNTTLTNATAGGTWTSGTPGVATINASTGLVTTVAAGTTLITYTIAAAGGCSASTATTTVTVTQQPIAAAIGGTTSLCNGTNTTLTNATAGGTWTSGAPGVATINASTGLVTTVAAGTTLITYTIAAAGGCSASTATTTVTVTQQPVAAAIGGTTSLCNGTNTTLTNATAGGTWTSGTPGVATINASTGLVTTVAAGTTLITYTIAAAGGCFASTSTTTVTVTQQQVAAAIGGTTSLCNGTNTTLTNATAGGTWTSGTPGVATINASTGLVTTVAAGTTLITYTIAAVGGCSASTATTTVNVTQQPIAAAIGGTTSLCNGTNTTLTNATAGGTWASGTPGVATINASTGLVTTVAAGTTLITYTIAAAGGCSASTATTTVTVTQQQVAAAIGGTTSLCNGTNTTLTNATAGGTWTSGTPGVATINSSTGLVTTVSAGTTLITYTIAATGGCSVSTATTTVTVTQQQTAAAIGGTTSLCNGTNTTLTNATAGGTWTSGTPGVATINASTGLVTTLAAGTTLITYTIAATGGCSVSTATTTLTVNATPAAPTGTNGSRISTGTVNISASVAGGVTVDWYAASTGGSVLSGGTGTTSFTTPSISVTTIYYAEARNITTGCISSRTPVTATVYADLAGGTIGASQTFCGASDPAAFTSIAPATGSDGNYTYQWQTSTDGNTWGDILGANSATYDAGSLSVTTYFKRKVEDGLSTVAYSNTISVTINSVPALPGAVNGNRTGTGTVNLSATVVTGTVDWYDAATNGTLLLSGNTAFTTPSISTTTIYYAEGRNLNGCISTSRTAVTATVYSPLTGGVVGGAQSLCGTSDPAPLTSSSTGTGGNGVFNYQWQSSTDGVIYSDIIGETNTTYDPPSLSVTTYFRRKVTDGVGNVAYASPIIVTINEIPAAPEIFTPWNFCKDGASSELFADGTNLLWYTTSVGGVGSGTTPTPSTATVGTNNYYVSQTINGCESPRAEIVVNVNPIPSVPVAVNGSRVGTGSVYLSASAGVGMDIKWYSNNIDPVSFFTGANTNPFISATTTYYIRASDPVTGCISDAVPIVATVFPALTGGTLSSSQVFCATGDPAVFTVSVAPTGGDGNYTYRWEISTDDVNYNIIGGATSPTYDPGVLTATTYYRRRVTDGTEAIAYSNSLIITVNPQLTSGSVSGNQVLCDAGDPAAFTNGSAVTGGNGTYTYQWQNSTDNISFSNIIGATSATYDPGVISQTTYYKRIVSSTGCVDQVSNTLTVTVNPPLTSGTITGAQAFCDSGNPIAITESVAATGGNGIYTYQWQSSTDNLNFSNIGGATSASYDPAVITQTTYYRRVVSSTGCVDATSSVIIVTINATPVVAAIGGTTTLCAGFTTTLTDATASGVWSSSNTGVATINGGGLVTAVAAGTTTITYTVTTNGCVGTATATFTVNAIPTVAAISGTTTLCAGFTTTLTDATASGVWSSSNTGISNN
jgi:hypothetical protein